VSNRRKVPSRPAPRRNSVTEVSQRRRRVSWRHIANRPQDDRGWPSHGYRNSNRIVRVDLNELDVDCQGSTAAAVTSLVHTSTSLLDQCSTTWRTQMQSHLLLLLDMAGNEVW
jgi:hypothetical protein